jgi:uncharacterized protein YuzB (UPF0349 family)
MSSIAISSSINHQLARLPYPGPSYVSGVMHQFPQRLQRKNISRMLSYAPTALPPYYTFSFALLEQLELDPKLRELAPEPLAEVHSATARRYGLVDGELVTLRTRRDMARFKVKVTPAIREDTIFVPFQRSIVDPR